MKLIEMRCPNCDAPLSVNAERDEAFCRHCNTTFLIEGAPKAESRNRPDAVDASVTEHAEPEEFPDEATVEFENAKSEPPETVRFAGAAVRMPGAKTDARPAKTKTKPETPRMTAAPKKAVDSKGLFESSGAKRLVTIVVAIVFVVVFFSARACSAPDSQSSAGSDAYEASGSSISSSSSAAASSEPDTAEVLESSAASETAAEVEATDADELDEADAQESSESDSSASDGASAVKDGFPCNLDSTATFSGITIPIDSTWKDNSPEWDWRHKTFSYTAGDAALEDVQVSISTFTGGDTKDPVAFMKDYADSGPIFLYSGVFTVISEDVRDGVTYTLVEGVDSHYESSFSSNPSSKYQTIRESSAGDVVRCICLVGYAEDGAGFAAAVSLRGSADNQRCIHSARKILEGVSFVPAECDTDSVDSWLYALRH